MTHPPTNHPDPRPRRSSPKQPDPFSGVLLVDKPSGMTSHDVVYKIRRGFQLRKVGHGGTLDPMATGLLPILIGRGTKLSATIMGGDKIYEGTIHLGVATDSEDADGTVLEERDASGVSEEALRQAMAAYKGDRMQTPPMVSAVKIDGVPLYKLARKGKTVEREARLIHVYEFTLLDFEAPRGRFRLSCTKGTYVRTLCADIGRELGCGAHLSALSRTRNGAFRLEDAAPLDELLALDLAGLEDRVIPVHAVPTEA